MSDICTTAYDETNMNHQSLGSFVCLLPPKSEVMYRLASPIAGRLGRHTTRRPSLRTSISCSLMTLTPDHETQHRGKDSSQLIPTAAWVLTVMRT